MLTAMILMTLLLAAANGANDKRRRWRTPDKVAAPI